MAGGAKSNEQFRPVQTRRPVMDGQSIGGAAGAAAPAVAFQDLFAQTGKKAGRPPEPKVTALAAARGLGVRLPAGAEQGLLLVRARNGGESGQEKSLPGIASDKRYYHKLYLMISLTIHQPLF